MILCLGLTPALQRTMVFDDLASNAVNRAVEVYESPAGKSVNVARVLRAMEGDCLAMGFIGGARGELLLSHLDAAGVPHDFVRISPQTRLCTTLINRASREVTELVEESAAAAPEAPEDVLGRLQTHLPGAQMLILSGSLTPGVPQDFYRRCLELARRHAVPGIVDAQGPPLLLALPSRPLLVKPNRVELAATLGTPVQDEPGLRAAMTRLVEQGARNVMVTMGAEGAVATDGSSFRRVRVPAVEAVNPIGSGDSFTAGAALALSKGASLDEACRLGAACATANALTLLSGTVDRADVARLLPQVDLRDGREAEQGVD